MKNKISYLILVVIVLNSFLLFAPASPFVAQINNETKSKYITPLNYKFENFTKEEEEAIKNYILTELNQIYFIKDFKIIFTKEELDLSSCKDCSERTIGLYVPLKKQIYIKVDDVYNIDEIKGILCHELLHHFIKDSMGKLGEANNHEIVISLAKKRVCYL